MRASSSSPAPALNFTVPCPNRFEMTAFVPASGTPNRTRPVASKRWMTGVCDAVAGRRITSGRSERNQPLKSRAS